MPHTAKLEREQGDRTDRSPPHEYSSINRMQLLRHQRKDHGENALGPLAEAPVKQPGLCPQWGRGGHALVFGL